jgi:hypothetical protein
MVRATKSKIATRPFISKVTVIDKPAIDHKIYEGTYNNIERLIRYEKSSERRCKAPELRARHHHRALKLKRILVDLQLAMETH